MINNYNINK